ncbi:MAG: helix-turn-helix domain-containing protein [Flavitalea sp.]
MYARKTPLPIDCGLHLTKEILNGKWKASLLHAVSMGIRRPSEMLRLFPGVTRRVLNVQLKELEMHGMVEKKTYPQLPPKVEYSLTEIGRTLLPVIDAMNKWGDKNRSYLETVISQTPKIGEVSRSTCQMYQEIAAERKAG